MQSKLSIASRDQYVICPDCDLLMENSKIEFGCSSYCARCGHLLTHPVRNNLEMTLVLAVSGLLLFLPAMLLPLLHFSMLGNSQDMSMMTGVISLFQAGYPLVAAVALWCSILVPLVNLVLIFWVSAGLKKTVHAKFLISPFRWYCYLKIWGMLDVFTLAILVAAIKLKDDAELLPGIGLYCFAALLLVSVLQFQLLDNSQIWRLIERRQYEK